MNSNAAVKGQQGHLPFGEDFGETGTQQQKQHFTSYERDSQSGTDYAVNRAYSFEWAGSNQQTHFSLAVTTRRRRVGIAMRM